MTTKFEYYDNEGVSSATIAGKEAESKISTFNPEERLRNLSQRRGRISTLALKTKGEY